MSDEERARNMIAAHWGFDRAHMRTAIMEALSAARAEEREACARIAEDYPIPDQTFGSRSYAGIGEEIAAAIRGRK